MKYDDNKIAERVPIDELRSGMYQLPEWAEGLFDITPEGQPRRRRRLTHLFNEEKILRRKLKNRVAAQNARDKKRDESERIKIENENLHQTVSQLKADAEIRESELDRLRRENAALRNRLGLSPPAEEIILVPKVDFDDSGINSPMSSSGSPPAVSKDPNETRADEMSDDSTDDELINNWIQEAAGFSPQIEAKWQPAAQSSPENAEGYDFDDFEKFMSDENLLEQLHPYSNDDLESFLL